MSHRILIADDDPAVHQQFQDVLGMPNRLNHDMDRFAEHLFAHPVEAPPQGDLALKYALDHTLCGEQAIEMFRRAYEIGTPHAMAFVDIAVPTAWDGVRTVEQLWDISEKLRIVICSSHLEFYEREISIHLRRSRKLLVRKKPFDGPEIAALARALCDDRSDLGNIA